MELKNFNHISSSCSSNSSSIYNFTTEEIFGCTYEADKGATKVPRKPSSCFLISSFTVSVTPSIDTPESSNGFMILIISF